MTANRFTVVDTDVSDYSASPDEFVKTSGNTVTLPDPSGNADAIVAVRDEGQGASVTSAAGNIDGSASKTINTDDGIYLVSDGSDWFSVNSFS